MTVKPQGHKWRTLTRQYRHRAQQTNTPCWLCGNPIDWNAPPQSRWAFEIDHAQPKSTHPHLAWDDTNFRTSHAGCNRRRGDKPAHQPRKYYRWKPANW